MKSKVTVVGAGNVGATTAQRIFEKGHSDVVLIDVITHDIICIFVVILRFSVYIYISHFS